MTGGIGSKHISVKMSITGKLSRLDGKPFFILILIMILLTNIIIILNIPFLRQIFGFFFLTLLPGLLILQVLKLNKIESTEKFVLAVGLSISFLMFFGLLINSLSLSIGYKTPLSTIPLLISFTLAYIVFAIIGYRSNIDKIFSLPNFNLSTSEKIVLIVPILFPALSIFGMHVMNTTDNNIILIFLLFLIPIYVASVCFFNQKFPKRLYPVVIFLISISLLLMMSLRSNHLIGVDTHTEYYFFRTTLNNLHWSIIRHSSLDACLVITLLPTISQSILNISPEFLYKILHSLLFSISPLVIYVLSKRYIGEFYGFLTSFFFMIQGNFFGTALQARTNTAILFFALATMILFSDKIDPLKKRILFIVFMASCIISHYSTAYIFFFVMLVSVLAIEALSVKYTFKKAVSLTLVTLFFGMIFFWYSQVTETPFYAGVGFIEATFSNLNEFFLEESRSASAQSMLGVGILQKGIPHKIEFVLTWLVFAFIGIGVITLIRRYKQMSFPELNFKKADFLKEKFEIGYFVIALVLTGLLVATVALPHITVGYSLDRQYLFAMVVLSVIFVIGGIVVAKYLNKLLSKIRFVRNKREVHAYLIILLVLIPYFLCVSGVMYQVFGDPRAITLNSEGPQYDMLYIHDQESYGMRWLGRLHAEEYNPIIYVAPYGGHGMISQAKISNGNYLSIAGDYEIHGGSIYLGYYNIVKNKIVNSTDVVQNMTEYSDIFDEWNKVYSNGGSEIWR